MTAITKSHLYTWTFFLLALFVGCYLATISMNKFVQPQNLSESSAETSLYFDSTHPPEEIRNLVYVKTYKSGSTTLQNIFYRKAFHSNITVILPRKTRRECKLFDVDLPFSVSQVEQLPKSTDRGNFILNHLRVNFTVLNQVIPKNEKSVYVTILRDAPDVFESRISYFNTATLIGFKNANENPRKAALRLLQRSVPLRKTTGRLWDVFQKVSIVNAYYFQFQPKSGNSQMALERNFSFLDETIEEMDQMFNVVLISEMFDESLVVLQRQLNWPLSDFVYFSQMERQKGPQVRDETGLTPSEEKLYQKLVRQYLEADDKMYQFFKQRLLRQIEDIGREIVEEDVLKLRRLKDEAQKMCKIQKFFSDIYYRPHNHFSTIKFPSDVKQDKELFHKCREFQLSDEDWCRKIASRQNVSQAIQDNINRRIDFMKFFQH